MNHHCSAEYPILVHSHLRWDWVWQRPQQFLSRLSARHPVLFVEEPMSTEGLGEKRATLREVSDFPNLLVLRTEFPPATMANRERVDAEQRALVKEVIALQLPPVFERPVQWFYDPMAAPTFIGQMNERAIVYDCMDQLSQFRGAPPELVQRERALLRAADVVFAGGPKIHKAKQLQNPNCHAYGCGVDVQHFGEARRPETPVPEDLARIPGPRLGYFGVVDERMDYDLLSHLATARPEWSVVIVGPHAKVDPRSFPQHPNLHWLGGRSYQELPGYVKGFDVCLMPFANNEATEFINPTKALEYMATGRPIVSTLVDDVVLQFSDVVCLAGNPAEFVRQCEQCLRQPDTARTERGLRLAEQNSWERIVAELERHVAACLVKAPSAEEEAA